ncbi:MAG: hypothetical protein GX970_04625 [Phyllobacteriaceae bacterium]|nr:hypothetical protein [Phyllobacteriaceae bacterium]
MANDEGRKILARIEAKMALEIEDRAYWLRHQRGEVSVEEAAERLMARLYATRLMLDGVEPTPDKVCASVDELNFYQRSRH